MKVVILCGGRGTRIQEATRGLIPKPMVDVCGRPILWHIMKIYSAWGFKEFVLCLGHLSPVIKDYFLNYAARNNDITLDLSKPDEITYHQGAPTEDWKVTLVDTGQNAMTGARIAKIRNYVGDESFMLTYGDAVADVNLQELAAFHKNNGAIATLTGVVPIGRFGRMEADGHRVKSFEEKPVGKGGNLINGGFMVFDPGIFEYLSEEDSCVLEREPLEKLAIDGELNMFSHDGFWQCMDTYRDLLLLNDLWSSGSAPWNIWDDDSNKNTGVSNDK